MLSTTELFVEHIISGVLSMEWIGALVLMAIDINVSVLPVILDYWGLLAVLTTAVAYPLSIFVDTMADLFLDRFDPGLRRKVVLSGDVSKIQLVYLLKDENIRDYFTYNRFKQRVARSSALNFLLIGLFLPLVIVVRGDDLKIPENVHVAIVLAIVFLMMSVFSIVLWFEVSKTVHRRTKNIIEDNQLIIHKLISLNSQNETSI